MDRCDKEGARVRLAMVVAAIGGFPGRDANGEPGEEKDAIVVRLIHPDRQAAELLGLFEGGRGPSRRSVDVGSGRHRPAGQLGKPVEAIIALFNSEMIAEWRTIDGAEFRAGLDPASGGPGSFALIPGTTARWPRGSPRCDSRIPTTDRSPSTGKIGRSPGSADRASRWPASMERLWSWPVRDTGSNGERLSRASSGPGRGPARARRLTRSLPNGSRGLDRALRWTQEWLPMAYWNGLLRLVPLVTWSPLAL